MLFTRFAALAALVSTGLTLTAAGCGGPADTVTGTVHGATLAVNDAVSGIYTYAAGSLAVIALTTETTACADFSAGNSVKNATTLVVSVGQIDLKTLKTIAATAPGTFSVYKGPGLPSTSDVATVSWIQNDENCMATTEATGTSGTVSITAVDNGSYTGTGDVTFDSGDHVTFTFAGASCAAITTAQGVTTANCI